MNNNIHGMKYATLLCCFISLVALVTLIVVMIPVSSRAQSEEPSLKDIIKDPGKGDQVAAEQPKPVSEKPEAPQDELERGTPRTSVKEFFGATRKRDYEKAAQYLDLRHLPTGMNKSQGPQLARRLKIVLDRTVWVDLDTLSVDPKGHREDGLPSYRDLVCRIKTPEKEVDILLQRVPRGDGVSIWKFSSTTVAKIPELYKHFGYGKFDEVFPEAFFDLKFLGITIWMWIALFVFIVIAYLLAFIVTALATFILSRTKFGPSRSLRRFIAGPIRLLLTLLLVQAAVGDQRLSPEAKGRITVKEVQDEEADIDHGRSNAFPAPFGPLGAEKGKI